MTTDVSAGSPLADRVVFILGWFRSGTTWLEHLLLAHPAACGLDGKESWVFEALADIWSSLDQGALAGDPGRGVGVAAERRYVDGLLAEFRATSRPDATHLVEKSPSHTAHLDHMVAVYPDAWYVHIVRDGRDVVRSWLDNDGDDAESAARLWARALANVRAAAPNLPRFTELRYEDLVEQPVERVTGLLQWVGLEVDDDVQARLAERIEHHVSRRKSRGAPGPGKWRAGLTGSQVAAIERIAGPELDAWNYRR